MRNNQGDEPDSDKNIRGCLGVVARLEQSCPQLAKGFGIGIGEAAPDLLHQLVALLAGIARLRAAFLRCIACKPLGHFPAHLQGVRQFGAEHTDRGQRDDGQNQEKCEIIGKELIDEHGA